MEWNLRICLVPLATFGFQLRTLSFSPEICNLADTGQFLNTSRRWQRSTQVVSPTEFIGVWGLVTATYRQRHRTSKRGRTDGLHYTRRRPLFNAGGLIPHGHRLDAGTREYVRRAPARLGRRAPSRSDALGAGGGVRLRLSLWGDGSSTRSRRGVLASGGMHVPRPARGPLRSLWSRRLAGEGTGRRETGDWERRNRGMQAGKTQRPRASLSPRVGSDRLSPTTT